MRAAPALDDLLRRASSRRRRRTAVWGLAGGAAAGGALGCALALWRIVEGAVQEPPLSYVAVAGIALGVVAAGGVAALAATALPRDDEALAREIDLRLGLEDRAATALAILREKSESRLAPFVLAQSEPVFAAAGQRIDAAFSGGPAPRTVRTLRRAAVFFWVLLAILGLLEALRLLDWPFGLLARGPLDVGILPEEDPSAPPGPLPAPKAPPGETGPERGAEPKEEPGDLPAAPPGKPEEPPPQPPPPEGPKEPDVRADVKPTKEEFGLDDPVLVVATVTPLRDLERERDLVLTLSVDGKTAETGVSWTLGPGAQGSRGDLQDLRHLPGLSEKLLPGEHEVTAEVRDRRTGETFRSAPAKFRVGDGNSSQSPPPQQPEPQPEPEPQPGAQPEPPPAPGVDEPPPEEGPAPPTPEIRPEFDPRVVVPLFGEGEEVAKKGFRIVLVPGGGPGDPPKRVAAADAVPDAARRAEAHVDRAGVRAEDREIVRRYFEALLRGTK